MATYSAQSKEISTSNEIKKCRNHIKVAKFSTFKKKTLMDRSTLSYA